MQVEYVKRLMKGEREEQPSAGEVRTLGLVKDQKLEDINMKPPKWLPVKGPNVTDERGFGHKKIWPEDDKKDEDEKR